MYTDDSYDYKLNGHAQQCTYNDDVDNPCLFSDALELNLHLLIVCILLYVIDDSKVESCFVYLLYVDPVDHIIEDVYEDGHIVYD